MLSVSSIRTIPSASEFHRISGGAKGAAGRGLYRRWGIAPRPETDFLSPSIAQVLKNASGYGIIAANAAIIPFCATARRSGCASPATASGCAIIPFRFASWYNSRKRGYYTAFAQRLAVLAAPARQPPLDAQLYHSASLHGIIEPQTRIIPFCAAVAVFAARARMSL